MEVTRLKIYRGLSVFVEPEIDLQTEFNEVLMGVDDITVNVVSPVPLNIQLDDYITFRNENYFIDSVPEYDLINNESYRYSMKFLHPKFRLNADYIVHLNDSTFTYFGDARAHLTVLLASIHSFDSEYTLGEIEETDQLFITYDGSYCLEALTIIAEAFVLEYKVQGKVIDLKKQLGHDTNLTFQYGRGKGLYTLNRKAINDENVFNKMYGYGSDKNIDYTYRNGAKRLTFEGGFLTADTPYALRAGRYVNKDIKPERTAPCTGVEPIENNLFAIYDSTLDFDINDYLIEAITAKVVFKSGELSGVGSQNESGFEIHKYDPVTKKITLKLYQEDEGYVLPNDSRMVSVGDTFTLVDMRQPEVYVVDAENRLQSKTQEFLNENKIPKIAYDLPIDPKYIRGLGASLRVGDLVTIIDPAHNINHKLRIIGVRLPLADETQVKVTIANFIPYTYEDRVIASAINNQKEIREVNRAREELARRASKNLRVLEDNIFDTDGNFDSAKFNVGVLSAALGIFGIKSQNFALSSVIFKPNYQGNANTFQVTNGKLIHREIENASGYEWNLTGLTMTGLTANSLYYVYAKCSRSTATGEFLVTTAQISYDQIAGQYHFLVGVLYPVNDGYRDYDNTYGISTIVGRNITTGVIKSISGGMEIDLDAGTIKGDITILSGTGNAETQAGAQSRADGALNASKTYVNTQISAVNGQILLKADTTTVNALGQRVTAAEASISVLPGQIESKVSKGDVISSINQSAESVVIAASKINLHGTVTVLGSVTAGSFNIAGNFVVSPAGIVTMKGANIEGHVNSKTGKIGDFDITNYGLLLDSPKSVSGVVLLTPGSRVQLGSLDDPYWPYDPYSEDFTFVSGLFEGRGGKSIVSTASGGGWGGNYSFYSRKGHIYLRDCLELGATASFAPKFSGHLRWIMGTDGNRYMVITNNSLFPE